MAFPQYFLIQRVQLSRSAYFSFDFFLLDPLAFWLWAWPQLRWSRRAMWSAARCRPRLRLPSLLCGRRCRRNIGTMCCCDLGLLRAIHFFCFQCVSECQKKCLECLWTKVMWSWPGRTRQGVGQLHASWWEDRRPHRGVWNKAVVQILFGSSNFLIFLKFRSWLSHRNLWP